jgi:hypothetical protein
MSPQLMMRCLVVAACAWAPACSRGEAEPVPAAAATAAATTAPATQAAAEPAQVSAQPVVVQAEISPAAQTLIQQIAPTTTPATTSAAMSTIQLTLKGAEAIEASNVALRVFVDNPTAGADTPVTDPSFVGTVNFFPAGEKEPTDYTLHLTPALKRLAAAKKLDLSKPLSFTLVPVPVRDREKGVPPQTKIGVSKVQVSVPQQPAP